MKKIAYFSIVLLILMLTACGNMEPEISQEKAESVVVEFHSGEIGEIKITSVTHKSGKYIIEWENEEDCASGIDHVDDQNGEIVKGKTSIC